MIISQDMPGFYSLVRRITGRAGLLPRSETEDRTISRVTLETEAWPLGAEGWIAEAATPGRGASWVGR